VGPRNGREEVESSEPQTPAPSTRNNPIKFRYYSQLYSTWAPLGVTGVVKSLFYHVCFILFRCIWCCWGSLAMVTDGANVLSVRSRTTRSSKGKASLILSLFHLDIQSDTFFLLLSSSSPPHVLPTFLSPLVHVTSSSPTQTPTPNNSRNNSVSLASTRLTQLATEIACFARSLTSCTVPSPATSNYERTFVTGSSHIACDTHLLLTTSAVWMFTFLLCVNLVCSPSHPTLFYS
jgi:hypothetical protein